MPVRIACVQYLNTAPLIEGLDKLAGIELVRTVPSRIAGLVESGDAEIGLVSLIDAARCGALVLLPAGMIGCDGPTLTVRLFSAVPMDEISAIHADTDSHTSIALCRIVLDRLHGLQPEIIDYDAREGVALSLRDPRSTARDPQTMLLIGDKVVTHAPPADRYPYQLDLGQAWHGLTGLPFVYAVWMCRAGGEGSLSVRTAAAVLDRQQRHNASRLGWIVSRRAAEHGWPADLAAHYLGSLMRYRIGEREREAAARFFEEAAHLGLAGGELPAWVDPAAA